MISMHQSFLAEGKFLLILNWFTYSNVEYPYRVEDVYHPKSIDHIVSCIHDRFNQPGYIQLLKLENVLVKAVKTLPY